MKKDVIGRLSQAPSLLRATTPEARSAAECFCADEESDESDSVADRPNSLHVLLTGDVEDRVKRAAKRLGISDAESAKRRASEEDVRRQMSKTLYGWDPTSPDRYDMLINTSRVSIDAAVNAIVDAIQHRNA